MRISVLVACYNAEHYIGEALGSVVAQHPAPDEIIVVDDGSTDASAQLIAEVCPKAVLIRQPNQGVAAALNVAARHATGDILVFIDADDIWLPGKIAVQLGALESDATLDGVFGHMRCFASPDLSPEIRATVHVPDGSEPGFVKGTLMIRRSAFDRFDPFNESRRFADFISWYANASAVGFRWAMVPDVVYLRRIHADNMGRRERGQQREHYLQTMKDFLDRRRSLKGPGA